MNEKLRRDGVPHTKLEFISNWASIDVRRRDGAAEARRTMGWGDDFVVMHAGNVGLAQGLDALVDAAAMLPARPELRFVVLGDGAARESLERRAERSGVDKIDFVPYQPRERARDLMATADLHVISLRQGLAGAAVPSKVYEILALGRPFVAAVEPNSEIARIVEETGAGIRVDPGDAAALAASVLDFAEGSKDPSEAGRRGRAEFESKYTSELAIAKYRSLLEATQA
jgi:colanic acid biosynthesis glycosyl transferase WcaI